MILRVSSFRIRSRISRIRSRSQHSLATRRDLSLANRLDLSRDSFAISGLSRISAISDQQFSTIPRVSGLTNLHDLRSAQSFASWVSHESPRSRISTIPRVSGLTNLRDLGSARSFASRVSHESLRSRISTILRVSHHSLSNPIAISTFGLRSLGSNRDLIIRDLGRDLGSHNPSRAPRAPHSRSDQHDPSRLRLYRSFTLSSFGLGSLGSDRDLRSHDPSRAHSRSRIITILRALSSFTVSDLTILCELIIRHSLSDLAILRELSISSFALGSGSWIRLLQRRHTLGMVGPRFLPEADTPAHWVFLPARSFTFQRRQQLVLVHPHSSDWGRYTLLHTYLRAASSHFYTDRALSICLPPP